MNTPKPTKTPAPKTPAPAPRDELADAMREFDASGADAGLADDTNLEDMLGDDDDDLDPDKANAKDILGKLTTSGNSATDAKEEMSEALKAFKANAAKEAQTMAENVDSTFWCCLVFQSTAQKEHFLRTLGLLVRDDTYLDGDFVAKKLGVTLPPASPRFNTEEEERKMAALPAIRKKPTPKK